MGWLKKKIKQRGKGIKKVGKKIGGAFKKLLKPFAKIFNKLGPLGSIAMMMILPGIGQLLAGWGAGMSSFMGNVIKFVGNTINFVATAPQKIFQTLTGGISSAWNAMTGGLTTTSATGVTTTQSWWDNFSGKVADAWTGSPVTDVTGLFGTKGAPVGGDTFWDVSKAGQTRIANVGAQWSGPQGFKEDIKNLFAKDPRTPLTKVNAPAEFKTLFTDSQGVFDQTGYDTALETFMDKNTVDLTSLKGGKVYKVDSPGVLGTIKDVTSGATGKIGDITIPGVGDVSDVASVSSTAMGAYSTLAQYGVVGSEDDPYGSGGGMTFRAEEQLYGGDQGGMYNITPPIWSYDYNQTYEQNRQNSMNVWNNTILIH